MPGEWAYHQADARLMTQLDGPATTAGLWTGDTSLDQVVPLTARLTRKVPRTLTHVGLRRGPDDVGVRQLGDVSGGTSQSWAMARRLPGRYHPPPPPHPPAAPPPPANSSLQGYLALQCGCVAYSLSAPSHAALKPSGHPSYLPDAQLAEAAVRSTRVVPV